MLCGHSDDINMTALLSFTLRAAFVFNVRSRGKWQLDRLAASYAAFLIGGMAVTRVTTWRRHGGGNISRQRGGARASGARIGARRLARHRAAVTWHLFKVYSRHHRVRALLAWRSLHIVASSHQLG